MHKEFINGLIFNGKGKFFLRKKFTTRNGIFWITEVESHSWITLTLSETHFPSSFISLICTGVDPASKTANWSTPALFKASHHITFCLIAGHIKLDKDIVFVLNLYLAVIVSTVVESYTIPSFGIDLSFMLSSFMVGDSLPALLCASQQNPSKFSFVHVNVMPETLLQISVPTQILILHPCILLLFALSFKDIFLTIL